MRTADQPPDRLAQREAQMQQAEELLGTMPQKSGVAKGLFEGHFVADWIFPYPQLPSSQRVEVERAVTDLESFCDAHLDPERIDREADIPREVIDGLANFLLAPFPRQTPYELPIESGRTLRSLTFVSSAPVTASTIRLQSPISRAAEAHRPTTSGLSTCQISQPQTSSTSRRSTTPTPRSVRARACGSRPAVRGSARCRRPGAGR